MNEWINQVHTGDCLDVLAEMPADSVHMCMTSPPYYGLRDYGVDGQLGLEESLNEYVENLVSVGKELGRVLRDDGSWWLNLGDSYAGSGRNNDKKTSTDLDGQTHARGHIPGDAFQQKDKMLVPHRAAIALQESGWVVRNDVTWVKPNPMPQSVKDRLNCTTEQIFHLTPEPNYYYNLDAIRQKHKSDRTYRGGSIEENGEPRSRDLDTSEAFGSPLGKNPGDVFEVTTKPFPDAHFAVYPPELCEKPIKATCPEDGIVLDPFAGAGTTLLKAKDLGRQFVGIELNPKYADMARARVGLDVHDPSHVSDDEDQTHMGEYQ